MFLRPLHAIALPILVLAGCASSSSDVADQSDRYAAKEVALRHMITEFPPGDGYCFVITDPEDSDRLITALSGFATPVIRMAQVSMDEGGRDCDSQTGSLVIRLGVEINSIDGRYATLTTELDAGPEGGVWYTVILRKQDGRWIVDSTVVEAHS